RKSRRITQRSTRRGNWRKSSRRLHRISAICVCRSRAAMKRPLLSSLRRDERGSYVIEFALLCLPMMTLLMGGIELGYLAYSKSNVEGALREVTRLASTGSVTEEELD